MLLYRPSKACLSDDLGTGRTQRLDILEDITFEDNGTESRITSESSVTLSSILCDNGYHANWLSTDTQLTPDTYLG